MLKLRSAFFSDESLLCRGRLFKKSLAWFIFVEASVQDAE